MTNLYPPEVAELDARYQKEPTIQNELALEKAKLRLYQEQLKENPGDKELQWRVKYHAGEVARLEAELRIA